LFSSLVALPRTLASASTGYLIEALGYPGFFLICSLIALPGLWLLSRVAPWGRDGLAALQPVHAPEQQSP
jgi:PAT family beta-lactamase induction signal transducer AmpG